MLPSKEINSLLPDIVVNAEVKITGLTNPSFSFMTWYFKSGFLFLPNID